MDQGILCDAGKVCAETYKEFYADPLYVEFLIQGLLSYSDAEYCFYNHYKL